MAKLFIAMEGQVLTIVQGDTESGRGKWQLSTSLRGKAPQCIGVDPFNEGTLYCGTFGNGLWITKDTGRTWDRTGEGVIPPYVTAVAVSRTEKVHGSGVVYAGTEPSELYRSDDAGGSWRRPAELTDLPSAASWSFPPRPDTHHVRYVSADPVRAGLLYVAIEAGALIRSFDGGRTWKDRVEGGPYDTHTLETNGGARGRLYSAAGDGYFESDDHGESWRSPEKGLKHHYLYSVSVHPNDPDTVLVSASPGPWSAYNAEAAESYVYRRANRQDWQRVLGGLPAPDGTTISALLADPYSESGFYAANNRGLYRSTNAGLTWQKLPIPWPESYETQHVRALAVVSERE